MFWRNKNKNIGIGGIGEKEAAKFLKKKGFKIIEFNFQNKRGRKIGEIDIVAKKDREMVFVEVKTRLANKDGILPEENINFRKLRSLQKIAEIYIKEKNISDIPYHFDAVSILVSPLDGNILEINHLENIFI